MSRVLPILFNTDMVRAILDGRKTTTRRVIKNIDIEENDRVITLYEKNADDAFSVSPIESAKKEMSLYSRYQPGDILYVRETWQCWRAKRYEATADIRFRAGGDGVQIQFENGNTDSIYRDDYDEFVRKWYSSYYGEWRPSIHMPKEAARIWLKVTDVSVERLQDITNEQILKEGIEKETVIRYMKQSPENTEEYDRAAHIIPFSELWGSTVKKSDIGRYDWDTNPWVWVIEFERCEKPEGEIHT